MPAAVIAISGFSNSGKTRVATSIVRTLTSRGYRVAALKHCHDGVDFDRPYSDTTKLGDAGAAVVMASAPGVVYYAERLPNDPTLESLLGRFVDGDVEVIIAEGYKTSSVPKVLVVGDSMKYPVVENAFAVVCDQDSGLPDLPTFPFKDPEKLVDMIVRRFL